MTEQRSVPVIQTGMRSTIFLGWATSKSTNTAGTVSIV